MIVFTSDHGDFLGDHGMILKGPMHYQSTVKVPFIWSDPKAETEPNVSQLSSSIDIAPTILSRAALPPYWGMQGEDLFSDRSNRNILVEDDGNRASLGFEEAPRVRTLVTERFRLSIYQDQAWGELYDSRERPERDFQPLG